MAFIYLFQNFTRWKKSDKYICLCLYFNGSSEITLHFFFYLKPCLHKTLVLTTQSLVNHTRSVEYTQASTDAGLCDRIITEGWYRVSENGNTNIVVRVEDIVGSCIMSSTLTTIWHSHC